MSLIWKIFEEWEKIELLVDLARNRRSGTPRAYADKLGWSLATFYRKLDILRRGGIPIKYDSEGGFYYLERPVRIEHRITIHYEDTDEKRDARVSLLEAEN